MENETKITIKLPADLLESVKVKAEKEGATVSSLVRNFFLAYTSTSQNINFEVNSANSIYTYQDIAKRKRELKEAVKCAHEEYKETKLRYSSFKKDCPAIIIARDLWKQAVADYNNFCAECQQAKN